MSSSFGGLLKFEALDTWGDVVEVEDAVQQPGGLTVCLQCSCEESESSTTMMLSPFTAKALGEFLVAAAMRTEAASNALERKARTLVLVDDVDLTKKFY